MKMKISGPDRAGAWVEDVITDPHGARWVVAAWVVAGRGRPVIGELRVYPATAQTGKAQTARKARTAREAGQWDRTPSAVPPGGLERRLLVQVPLGRYVPAVMARVSEAATQPGGAPAVYATGANLAWVDKILPGAASLAPRPRPERNVGRSDAFYAELAAAYVQRLAEGSVSPVQDLAAKRGKTAGRIRDLLHEARVRGLLSQGEAGRRGGYLLPRARQVLGDVQRTPPRRRTR
jgi:hypothetical protein